MEKTIQVFMFVCALFSTFGVFDANAQSVEGTPCSQVVPHAVCTLGSWLGCPSGWNSSGLQDTCAGASMWCCQPDEPSTTPTSSPTPSALSGLTVADWPSNVPSTYQGVRLTWNHPTNNAASYRIVRTASTQSGPQTIGSVTGNAFVDTNVVGGTTYQYSVVPVSSDGRTEGTSQSRSFTPCCTSTGAAATSPPTTQIPGIGTTTTPGAPSGGGTFPSVSTLPTTGTPATPAVGVGSCAGRQAGASCLTSPNNDPGICRIDSTGSQIVCELLPQINPVALPTSTSLSNQSIPQILTNVLTWLMGVFGLLAIGAFIVSGIQYLTSAGNDRQIETAKRNMMWSMVGVVVALSSIVIVRLIADALSGTL